VDIKGKCMNNKIPNLPILSDLNASRKDGFSMVYLVHGTGMDKAGWLGYARRYLYFPIMTIKTGSKGKIDNTDFCIL